jgi:hypothetical protein
MGAGGPQEPPGSTKLGRSRHLAASGAALFTRPSRKGYSPNVVEGVFSEVRTLDISRNALAIHTAYTTAGPLRGHQQSLRRFRASSGAQEPPLE